ncbi:odorant receptor 4-like [Diachasmimorpha longicaudata]|uniref:odorant receptor 4-like n=1 Tax=Diachasmimorpha longicaudata TaxID=58733 RepID=UPI0030B900C6
MSDSEKLRTYVAYREHLRWLLDFAGLWPSENSSLAYRMLPYLQIFVGCGAALKIGNFIAHHITSIRIVTRAMSIMTSIVLNMFRVVCLARNREPLIKARKILDNYFDELLAHEKIRDVVLHDVKLFRRLSLFYTVLTFFALFGYVLTPLIIIINQHIRHIQPVKYPLILLGMYPWNVPDNILIYSIHYVFEAFALFTVFYVSSGTDAFLPLLVFQVKGKLRAMAHRLTQLDEKDSIDDDINQCIRDYTALMECRDILEKTFGPIILLLMSNNAIILCALIFQFTQMKAITIVQIIQFAAYICGKTTQTFLYSWSGTLLTSKSDEYLNAVYASNWYGNRRGMKSVLITLNQRPLTMTAWHMSVVSVDMFVMVLNTTMSYFLLLQTIEQG